LILTREQTRLVDAMAVERYGIPGIVLMENAGRGVADTLERLEIRGPVAICCGPGNNGGDGFVVARHLHIRGHSVRILLWTSPDRLRGDALTNFRIVQLMNLPLEVVTARPAEPIRRILDQADWIVDALLGTGAVGEPKPPVSVAIDLINQVDPKRMAVDIPSGLDCDTGQPSARTVRADHTCTFFAEKPAMGIEAARPFLGQVHVIDIGAPLEIADRILSGDQPT
jgi:NAD(P)H-hydrate epimerase